MMEIFYFDLAVRRTVSLSHSVKRVTAMQMSIVRSVAWLRAVRRALGLTGEF